MADSMSEVSALTLHHQDKHIQVQRTVKNVQPPPQHIYIHWLLMWHNKSTLKPLSTHQREITLLLQMGNSSSQTKLNELNKLRD